MLGEYLLNKQKETTERGKGGTHKDNLRMFL